MLWWCEGHRPQKIEKKLKEIQSKSSHDKNDSSSLSEYDKLLTWAIKFQLTYKKNRHTSIQ